MALEAETVEVDHSEVDRRMGDMDTTCTMISEHLSSGILKSGQVNAEELSVSAGFIEKCIPALEQQLNMVATTYTKLPEESQKKHVKTIEKATKTLTLLKSLKQLAAETTIAQVS